MTNKDAGRDLRQRRLRVPLRPFADIGHGCVYKRRHRRELLVAPSRHHADAAHKPVLQRGGLVEVPCGATRRRDAPRIEPPLALASLGGYVATPFCPCLPSDGCGIISSLPDHRLSSALFRETSVLRLVRRIVFCPS